MAEPLFHTENEQFVITTHGVRISVERLLIPGYAAFRVEFSSGRKPITVARARDFNAAKFWTTIPEGQGREKEAAGVGQLIEEYFFKKENK